MRLRIPAYDYSETGAYFVTAVTEDRRALFGAVYDGEMRANRFGAIVEDCWKGFVKHYSHIALDEFVIMPNHFHGVIWLRDAGREVSNLPLRVRSAGVDYLRSF